MYFDVVVCGRRSKMRSWGGNLKHCIELSTSSTNKIVFSTEATSSRRWKLKFTLARDSLIHFLLIQKTLTSCFAWILFFFADDLISLHTHLLRCYLKFPLHLGEFLSWFFLLIKKSQSLWIFLKMFDENGRETNENREKSSNSAQIHYGWKAPCAITSRHQWRWQERGKKWT